MWLACRLMPVPVMLVGFVEPVAVVAVGEWEKVGELAYGMY